MTLARLISAVLGMALTFTLSSHVASRAAACSQPDALTLAAAFDLAAKGLLPPSDPQLPAGSGVHAIPPSLLKAVGWVESGWRQFDASGRPLVAPDFGYGIMQITSGMAGAFGDVNGDLAPNTQASIASDYSYNIAYGARILAQKWASSPAIGDGDPSVVENWYYALWAYNGWGWVNNPNNPRFTRSGTPATNPSGFPYQERVLYLVAHPPRDAAGNPMWQPVPVMLPSRSSVGTTPQSFAPKSEHRQAPSALSAAYASPLRLSALPNASISAPVRVENTGTLPWPATGTAAISLTYHLLSSDGDAFSPLSPFAPGVMAFAQGQTPLPRDVLSGHRVSARIQVRAPTTPGTYRVVWDLQQGAQTWFSQQGVLPRTSILVVGSQAGQTPTPTPYATSMRVAGPEGERYVRDTSVPDGSVLSPRQTFAKGWLVFNPGRSAWTSAWSLRHVSGPGFGSKRLSLPPTAACTSLNLVVPMRAPARAGSYRSTWRLYDANGLPIGDRLTVVVTVVNGGTGATPTPVITPTRMPTASVRASPTATPTPVG